MDDSIIKSRQQIKRDADRMYARSFGDLDDGTIYRDPCGWKTGDGSAIELQKDRFEQMAREPVPALASLVKSDEEPTVLNAWNRMQKQGFGIADTTKEIRKNLDTGDFTLPLDIIPEVFVVNPERQRRRRCRGRPCRSRQSDARRLRECHARHYRRRRVRWRAA